MPAHATIVAITLAGGRRITFASLALTLLACSGGEARPPSMPPTKPASPLQATPSAESPSAAPSRIDLFASDPWGRTEGSSIPAEALTACIRGAASGSSGWLLLRAEYETSRRPDRVTLVERVGLDDVIASCVVAVVTRHEEVYWSASRFVYVSVW